MFIDEILTENTGSNYKDDVQPTNEGYDNMSIVIMESIEDGKKLDIALEAVDYLMLKEAMSADTINEGVGDIAAKIKEHVKSALKKIKEIIKKMWAKVKEVYNSIKLNVFSVVSLDKFINLAKKQLNDLSDFKGVEVQGYDFSVDEGSKLVKDIDDKGRKIIDACKKKFEIQSKKASKETHKDGEIDNSIKLLNDATKSDKFKENVLSKVGTSESKFNEFVFKKLRGNASSTKTIKISSPSNAMTMLEEYKSTISTINTLESETNSAYSSSLSELDKMESALPDNDAGNKYATILQNIAKLYKINLDLINRVIGITITAAKDCKSQSISVVKKCISKGKSNKKEANKKLNEDTDLLSSIMARI